MALLLLPLAEGRQNKGSPLMPIEGIFLLLASIQAQIIVKGIHRNETAINNKDCKKETIETLMWLRRSCAIKLCEAECFVTTR